MIHMKISRLMREKLQASNRVSIYKYVLISFIIFIPLWMLYALLILNGKGLNPQIFIPTYNDEVAWFTQIESMITYGAPLGYEGYNATHAPIGTFGPWGIATLVPYAFVGKLIGWKFHSMVIANMLLLSAAIAIFIFLTRPSMKQLLWFAVGYVSMSITVGYSILAMAESLRYALAIVIAGMLIKQYRNEGGKVFTFVLIPFVILFSIQVYLIFALVIPVYVFLVLRDKKIAVRLAVSVMITAAAALIENYTLGLVTSPYTESTRTALIGGVMENPYQGMVEVIRVFINNLETINPVHYIELAAKNHGILVYFFISYLGLTALLIKRIKEKRTGNFYDTVSLYLLLGFLIGYCALYTGEEWTLCRGINTAMVFAVCFLLFEKEQKLLKYFVLFSLLAGISSWQYYAERIEQKDTAYAQELHILEERERISEIIDLSENDDRWENTIAHYGEVTNVYLELPIGIGTNYMKDESINTKARWAAISKCEEEFYFRRLERLTENNHEMVYENADLAILKYIGN